MRKIFILLSALILVLSFPLVCLAKEEPWIEYTPDGGAIVHGATSQADASRIFKEQWAELKEESDIQYQEAIEKKKQLDEFYDKGYAEGYDAGYGEAEKKGISEIEAAKRETMQKCLIIFAPIVAILLVFSVTTLSLYAKAKKCKQNTIGPDLD